MQPIVRMRHREIFGALVVSLSALSWLGLVAWGRSPYSAYLDHASLGEIAINGSRALLFVAGWVVMTTAMMLPTSLPLVRMFDRMVARRADHVRLVALLLGGYLVVWTAFGIVAHAGDLGVHAAVERLAWLHEREYLIGAATLAGAGAFQFSKLKYRCLEECRSPFFFLNRHWTGSDAGRSALALGVRHGLFCVGCCWALMLLMFAVGVGNLGWMLLLGLVMAVEKNVSWGRNLSGVVGGLLLFAGLYTAATAQVL